MATGSVTLTKPSGRLKPRRMRERQRLGDEEIEIFEIAENAEVERDAKRQHARAPRPLAADIEADEIADRAAGEQQ